MSDDLTVHTTWRRRRQVVALGLILASAPVAVHAMWVTLADEDLLRQSDLVVMGTWVAPADLPPGSVTAAASAAAGRMAMGGVAITEVLKGPPGLKQALVLTVPANAPRSSSDLVRRSGDQGLWLLRLQPGASAGVYLADHPQRFETRADRIAALRRLIAKR